jgi:hypothetical protein
MLRQRATPAEIAVVCQFTYLESERLLQCRRCIRHVNVEFCPAARIPGKLISGHNANTFCVLTVQSDQQLKHLKQAAREHLNLPGHAWCVEAEYFKQANAQS